LLIINNLFPTIWENDKYKIKPLAGSVSGKGPFPGL
jgi:hypothetical protein